MPLTYDIDHSDELFYLDPQRRERLVLEGIPYIAHRSQIPSKIYRFLTSEGRGNVASHKAGWSEPQAVQGVAWLLHKKIAP